MSTSNAEKILKVSEVTVSPKMPTRNYQDFCPGSLLEGRAEILVIFGWHFGRSDDLFILTFSDRSNLVKKKKRICDTITRGKRIICQNVGCDSLK